MTPQPITEELLSAQALADLCGVPVKTIYGWNYLGTGPTPIKVGRYRRYRRADVEQWLSASVVQHGTER